MKKQKSVTKFIIGALILGILVYAATLIAVVYNDLNKGLTDYFDEELVEQSAVIKGEINSSLKTTEKVARNIQVTFESIHSEFGFDTTIVDSMAAAAKSQHGVDNIVFFNRYGMQISDQKYGIVPKTTSVKDALTGKETIRLEKEGQNIYAMVVLPLKSGSKVFGAVEIRTSITNQELVDSVSDYINCDITIFDGNRRYLTTINGMKDTLLNDSQLFEDSENGLATTMLSTINGQRYICYYFPFYDENGNFLTTIFMGKELGLVTSVALTIFKPLSIVTLILTIALVVLFGLLLYAKMINPLNRIRKAVGNLSSGDADLTARIPVKGNDEYAALGNDVNKFIEMLQTIIKQLGVSQGELNSASETLGQSAQDSASATAEILANIESVRKQSQNQADAVQNTSNVLEMSSVSVEVLTKLIDDQSAGISESSAAIEEMLGNITAVTSSVKKMSSSFSDLNTTVDEGKSKLENVDQKVNQIAEQSKMLLQANKIISQIASETNLLAMNAAIEAAHAGEAGKGFSVVAEEIRKLAENSGIQSKNINSELKEISNSIQDVVSLSQDSQTAFGAIVNQLTSTDMIIQEINNAMEEQQTASKQIFEALGDMKDKSGEVSQKAEDMSRGITDVARDMNTVAQISTTILGSMDEMTAGMQQIGNATQDVSNLAGTTKENIETMSTQLGQFKV